MPEDLFAREGVPHGNTRYTNGHCRCDVCKADHALYQLEATIKRRKRIAELPDEAHGKPGTYTNWGCRCPSCKWNWAEYNRARRARPKKAEATPRVVVCNLGYSHEVHA